jgi:hypothetical protein
MTSFFKTTTFKENNLIIDFSVSNFNVEESLEEVKLNEFSQNTMNYFVL